MATDKYIKINGVQASYRYGTLQLHFEAAAPANAKLVLVLPYTDALPLTGHTLEVFRRDDTRIFNGTIHAIDHAGIVETGSYLEIQIEALGKDDRLYRRTTWNRITYRCAQYRSYAGHVDTAGTTASWIDGDLFEPELVGKTVTINSVGYTVSAVPDPQHLTLGSDAGTQSNVEYTRTLYSGDVIKDLLDTYCDWEGFTYDGASIQDGEAIDGEILFDPPIFVQEAIGKILDLNPTFHFTSDVDQKCYFGPRTLVAAPLDFTDLTDAYKRGVKVSTSREDVRNVEINLTNWDAILPGDGTTGGVDTFTGDGSTRCWFTEKPIAQAVKAVFNGVEVAISDDPNADARFYYRPNGRAFWQNPLDPVMQAASGDVEADSVVFTYKPLASNLMEVIDQDACDARAAVEGSGLGRYEQVMDRSQYLVGKTPAYNASIASITRNRDNLIRCVIQTFDPGYAVGQAVTITIADRKIDAQMFIETVDVDDAEADGPYDFEYTLHCISLERVEIVEEDAGSIPPEMVNPSRRLTGTEVLRSLFDNKVAMTGGIGVAGTSKTPRGGGEGDSYLEYPIHEPLIGTLDGVNRIFTASFAAKISPVTKVPLRWVLRNQSDLNPFPRGATSASQYGQGQFYSEGNEVVFAVAPKIDDEIRTWYYRDLAYIAIPTMGRTGLWRSRPTSGDAWGGYNNAFPYDDDWLGVSSLAIPGGEMRLWWTGPLASSYPCVKLLGFADAPTPGFAPANVEEAKYQMVISHATSPTVAGDAEHHFGLIASMGDWGSSYGRFYYSGVAQSSLLIGGSCGHRDDLADTIPADLLTAYEFFSALSHSMQTHDEANPVVHTINDSYLDLYFNAIRINCGGTSQQASQTDWGTYTWAADAGYTGGEVFTGNGTGLYAQGRKGASFRYVAGRNLFFDQYPTSRYKVILGFKEHQYSSAGQRSISVSANGLPKLTGLDLYAEHGTDPFTEEFEVEIDNLPDGKLYLDFEGTSEAIVNHITVMPMIPTGVTG